MSESPEVYGIWHHPNDSPKDGTIHPIALRTLAAWESLAVDWPTAYTDDGYQRCGVCTQAIARRKDQHGHYYEMGPQEVLSLIVAHIRQTHPELQEAINAVEQEN